MSCSVTVSRLFLVTKKSTFGSYTAIGFSPKYQYWPQKSSISGTLIRTATRHLQHKQDTSSPSQAGTGMWYGWRAVENNHFLKPQQLCWHGSLLFTDIISPVKTAGCIYFVNSSVHLQLTHDAVHGAQRGVFDIWSTWNQHLKHLRWSSEHVFLFFF